MNSLVAQYFPTLDMTLALRHQLLDLLEDADLSFALPGNRTLGALCRQIGEYDHTYVEAFKTFKQDWSYQHPDKSVETSVSNLRAWYQTLEAEFKAVVSNLTEAQIQTQMVERGTGFDFPAGVVFHIYRESLLIFYAKASLYANALHKPLPQQWQAWIG